MGGNLYTEEIQKQLGVSGLEAESMKILAAEANNPELLEVLAKVNETITQEIRRSLDFYNSTASEDRITKVFVSGGSSKGHRFIDAVSEKIGMPVGVIDPFAKLKYNEKDFDPEYLQEIGPLMAVTVGLAIRRVGDK
jgi:type IV pilus assembly protein PilM